MTPATAGASAPRLAEPGDFAKPKLRHLLWRAVRLRCPHCGGKKIFATVFELKDQCPTCGMQLERGEQDYFVGAYLFNLIAVELILFFVVCGFVFVTWPDPPWDLITYTTAALMLSGCVFCYPFAKTTWLAVDLAIRPLAEEELHRPATSQK